jgi:hypothetical protein
VVCAPPEPFRSTRRVTQTEAGFLAGAKNQPLATSSLFVVALPVVEKALRSAQVSLGQDAILLAGRLRCVRVSGELTYAAPFPLRACFARVLEFPALVMPGGEQDAGVVSGRPQFLT